MKKNKWLRCVCFTLALLIAVLGVVHIYGLPKTYDTRNIAAFQNEEEGLVDGVVFGTSVVSQSWLTPVAFEEYGLAIYHLSTSVQPFGVLRGYLDYAMKTQDIKYAVIDVHGLRTEAIKTGLKPAKFRAAYLNIPDIFARSEIFSDLCDYVEEVYEFYGKPEKQADIIDTKDVSYRLPFINFHRRWVEGLKKADYVTVANKYMGADDRSTSFGVMDCSEYLNRWDFEKDKDIDDFQKKQLQNLFDYAKEKDIELVFINIPSFRSKAEQKEMAEIIDYCKKQGYGTIDFSTEEMLEETGIDVKKDFVNKGHLNSRGGVKVTRYVCQYLIDNGYFSEDRREDEKYIGWHTASEKYNKFYEKGWEGKEKLGTEE